MEDKPKTKIVKEIRCKCNSCKHVWHYTNKDIAEQKRKKSSNSAKDFYQACGCCVLGAMMPRDKVRELDRCSKCESTNITKKEVSHKVRI